MRNPAYKLGAEMTPESYESVTVDYWSDLNKITYRVAVERAMDYLINTGRDIEVIAEVQVGKGYFLELLKAYIELTGIKVSLVGTEEDEFLRNMYLEEHPDFDMREEFYRFDKVDTVFIVECLPCLRDWKDKLGYLWGILPVGAKVVIIDSLTPPVYRDALRTLPNAEMVYDTVVEEAPSFVTRDGTQRNLKVRIYKKTSSV